MPEDSGSSRGIAMKRKPDLPLPPHLSMDAYAEFVASNWKRGNVEQMRRQKEIEKHIDKPFCISTDFLSGNNGLPVNRI